MRKDQIVKQLTALPLFHPGVAYLPCGCCRHLQAKITVSEGKQTVHHVSNFGISICREHSTQQGVKIYLANPPRQAYIFTQQGGTA